MAHEYRGLSVCVPDVDLYHVLLTRHEGYKVVRWTDPPHFLFFSLLFKGSIRRVSSHKANCYPSFECVHQVMAYPDRLSKTADRIVEDFSWVQWDGHTQRLYYVTHTVTHSPAPDFTHSSTPGH